MELYRGYNYVLLFFIYGLAFFSMGISALQQNVPKGSNFLLLKSIKYLGAFGLIHGLTEWVIMIRLGNLLPDYKNELVIFATFINALSFSFLWAFGVKLLEYKGKIKTLYKSMPWIIFFVWLIGFIFSYRIFDIGLLDWLFIEDTMSRYFIGLPGGLITAYAINKYANELKNLKLKSIVIKLKGMAILFGLYSILAGVIVNYSDFFPASVINKSLFYNAFGFPVELGRTIASVGITILFISAIDIFRWETNEKIEILSKEKLLSQERRKLGHELHDGIIQNLFATGLQVENLYEMEVDPVKQQNLQLIKENLNNTILQVRDFIKRVSTHNITLEDLNERISEMVASFQRVSGIPIELNYDACDMPLGYISNEKSTQFYYIVQEAVSNAIKHSNGTNIVVNVSTNLKFVIATVVDNGSGFDIKKMRDNNQYGLAAMNERAQSVNGELRLDSSSKGTRVTITIPWEV